MIRSVRKNSLLKKCLCFGVWSIYIRSLCIHSLRKHKIYTKMCASANVGGCVVFLGGCVLFSLVCVCCFPWCVCVVFLGVCVCVSFMGHFITPFLG